jgi:hypothetical protein
MAIAGHVSPKMLAHYSHVRLDAKRQALDALSSKGSLWGYVTNHDTNAAVAPKPGPQVVEENGRPVRARTADLYRVNERSDGASSTYEHFSEHSVAARAVRNAYCSHVVPTRAGWQTAFWNRDKRLVAVRW